GGRGKFAAGGSGAFGGSIAYPAMGRALARGYAAASTDTGHAGNTASFALGHPEKLIDFGWRAVHEMTVAAKTIVAAHFGAAPRFSYWNGCSAGGRQAMAEAQRFPADFDGLIAGAPGPAWARPARPARPGGRRGHHRRRARPRRDRTRRPGRARRTGARGQPRGSPSGAAAPTA